MRHPPVLGLIAAVALTSPAWGQVSIVIGIGPPPVRIEAPPPPPPAPAMFWVPGFWAPEGPQYRWIAGHYEHPPYADAGWAAPRYVHGPDGWHYHKGYWVQHGHGHAYGHYKHDHDDDDDHDHDHDHGHGHGHDRD
jgi:WXXGXW repeat (2 copies)